MLTREIAVQKIGLPKNKRNGRNYRRVAHTTSEGVLYIDIIDTKSKQLVWQGKGIGFLSSNRMNRDELVEGYVNKILSVYPPQEEVSVN